MLNVNPEIEANLIAIARRRGLSMDAFLEEMVAQELGMAGPVESGEDKARAFMEWADSFPDDAPPLSDEAISRDNLYPDRW
ncbi:MAG: hypothetical protein FJW31_00230 [Acidobacteria bacterium]|nr:hypothetical protein [Acidobacteriota bacterium]